MTQHGISVTVVVEDETGGVREWTTKVRSAEEAVRWLERRAAFERLCLDAAARWPGKVRGSI